MIRRHPQRSPRRQHQDFHLFAAGDPTRTTTLPAPREHEGNEPVTTPVRTVEPKGSDAASTSEPPAAPTQTIVTLIGPAERSAAAAPSQTEAAPAVPLPASKPRPRPCARKRATKARLATPRHNRSKPARQPSPAPHGCSDHERHCTICRHPDRPEIENEFMHWHTIGHIAYDYKVSRSAIYRHAYALGLFPRRNRNLRFALGHLIERVQDVEPTADSIVRAIHAFARINDEGEWVEPPAHVIVSSGGIRREAAAPPARRPIAIPLDSQTISSVIDVSPDPVLPGTVNRVETDATR